VDDSRGAGKYRAGNIDYEITGFAIKPANLYLVSLTGVSHEGYGRLKAVTAEIVITSDCDESCKVACGPSHAVYHDRRIKVAGARVNRD
jgi:hypothetical protein